MTSESYRPDQLYARLLQPWTLPEQDWKLCKEDWQRVDAITALPWHGHLLDFGAGDCTLAAMVCSRNPLVKEVGCIERDTKQCLFAASLWEEDWPLRIWSDWPVNRAGFDGALCCEVLEHLTPEEGHQALCDLKRVLKPGAMLCVTVPHRLGSRATYPGHIRTFISTDINDEIAASGFSIDEWVAIEDRSDSPIWIMVTAHA